MKQSRRRCQKKVNWYQVAVISEICWNLLLLLGVSFTEEQFKSDPLLLSQWTAGFVSQQMFLCLALWCKVASVEVGTLAASFEFSPIECLNPPPPKLLREGFYPSPLSPFTPCRPHSSPTTTTITPSLDLYFSVCALCLPLSQAFSTPHHTHTNQKSVYWPITAAWECILYLQQYTFKC